MAKMPDDQTWRRPGFGPNPAGVTLSEPGRPGEQPHQKPARPPAGETAARGQPARYARQAAGADQCGVPLNKEVEKRERRGKSKKESLARPRPSWPPSEGVTLSDHRRFACAESSWIAFPGLLPSRRARPYSRRTDV